MTHRLAELWVLGLDCQATHPDPRLGHLLEIGWLVTRACSLPAEAEQGVKTFLMELPSTSEIPRHVQKVTGISRNDLEEAVQVSEAAAELAKDMAAVGLANDTTVCPTVIHYSRYEQPFLQLFSATASGPSDEVYEILCTHEIVKRALPDLPRRGLRAVAGFFGHSVPERRRAGPHVVATARIWVSLVQLLQERFGVSSLDDLRAWMRRTPGVSVCGVGFPMRRRTRLAAPCGPGVYRMRRSNGDLLYVGKAASLKSRINSYFQRGKRHPDHILEMLTQATQLDVTTTDSALEAALLESDEIKTKSPPYNILLRGDEKRLLFVSRNLRQVSERPDRHFRLGPLVSRDSSLPLSHLAVLLSDPQRSLEKTCPGLLLGLPSRFAPEPVCLRQGVEEFCSRYPELGSGQGNGRRLLKLGAQLWRARRLEPQEGDGESDDSPAQEEENWDPDRVCRFLEEVALWGAHAVRRARWFCALSESAISWSARTDSEELLQLGVAGGKITRTEGLPPAPDRTGKSRPSLKKRQGCFDVATYDRLLVLTGELRRLLRQGRSVQVRISPGRVLDSSGLKMVLRWL